MQGTPVSRHRRASAASVSRQRHARNPSLETPPCKPRRTTVTKSGRNLSAAIYRSVGGGPNEVGEVFAKTSSQRAEQRALRQQRNAPSTTTSPAPPSPCEREARRAPLQSRDNAVRGTPASRRRRASQGAPRHRERSQPSGSHHAALEGPQRSWGRSRQDLRLASRAAGPRASHTTLPARRHSSSAISLRARSATRDAHQDLQLTSRAAVLELAAPRSPARRHSSSAIPPASAKRDARRLSLETTP